MSQNKDRDEISDNDSHNDDMDGSQMDDSESNVISDEDITAEGTDTPEQPLSKKSLEKFNKKHDNSAVLYMSRVPPHMKAQKVKYLLSKFGCKIGRIYLAAEGFNFCRQACADTFVDDRAREKRVKMGGTKRQQFKEGWIEFLDKKAAKIIADTVNSTPMGGKKRSNYYEDLWNLKYLPRFKWVHLKEQIAYERIARQKKLQVEMEKSKKEIGLYLQNVDRSKMLKSIEQRRSKDTADAGSVEGVEQKSRIRQRKSHDETEVSSAKISQVLKKLF